MKWIEGGVCAAQGFRASGVHCGIRRNHSKEDLALICSDTLCSGRRGVHHQQGVRGPHCRWTGATWPTARPRPSSATAATPTPATADGEQLAEDMCKLVAKELGIPAGDVLVCLHRRHRSAHAAGPLRRRRAPGGPGR